MRGEAGVSVQDNFLWESEPSVDMVEVKLGDPQAGDFFRAWKEDRRARAAVVNDGEDGVVSIGLR